MHLVLKLSHDLKVTTASHIRLQRYSAGQYIIKVTKSGGFNDLWKEIPSRLAYDCIQPRLLAQCLETRSTIAGCEDIFAREEHKKRQSTMKMGNTYIFTKQKPQKSSS